MKGRRGKSQGIKMQALSYRTDARTKRSEDTRIFLR